MTTEKQPFFHRFKKLIIGFAIFILLMVAFAGWLGFKHVPDHVRELWSMIKSIGDKRPDAPVAAVNAGPDTTAVLQPPMVPFDTVMWVNQVKKGEYVPDDVKRDIVAFRKIDFSKLKPAQDSPDSAEAQQAIVRRLGEPVIKLLSSNNASIRVGKCYNAPLDPNDKNKELVRVTAMISAFNKQNDNLRNISLPLDIIYDFVKYEADPNTWYVTDFSQTIPYDYQLNKD